MAYTTINKSTLHFNTKLYTGNGGTNAITGVGFQPDWIWFKNRTSAQSHFIVDAVRGRYSLQPNETNAAYALNAGKDFGTFDSDGFTVLTPEQFNSANFNGGSIVAWNWKASGSTTTNSNGSVNCTQSVNTTAGFSIFKWTGTGSGEVSIGHGFSTAPKIWFVKSLSTGQWFVYTTVIDDSLDYLFLHATDAKSDSSATAPTNSVIYGVSNTNQAEDYICYAFNEVKGYSKFGKYTGNGSTDGTFVYTGFKPAFVIIKNSSSVQNWVMFDNKRPGFNAIDDILYPNSNDSEQTQDSVDFLSNGFKIRASGNDRNGSGNTLVYMAFAEAPLVGSNNVPCTAR